MGQLGSIFFLIDSLGMSIKNFSKDVHMVENGEKILFQYMKGG